MILTSLHLVLRQLRRSVARTEAPASSDAQLVRRFVHCRDEAAFEELLRRHGPMVWGLCRRHLPAPRDAEDAFQATFLVLVQKAGSIREPASAASWLHGVAVRIARRARDNAERRREVERLVPQRRQPAAAAEVAGREEVAVVEEELAILPDRLRAPLVLCGLAGLTKAEAARRLGCKEGTLASRLARGRERLRARLARRGVVVPAAAVGGLLAEGIAPAAVPAPLVAAMVRTAVAFLVAGEMSSPLAALTRGAAGSAVNVRLRMTAALLLGLVVAGADLSARRVGEAENGERQNEPAKESQGVALPRLDAFGDPLPPGALARMGTTRLHQREPRAVFAADGKTLISVGEDYRIDTRDVATGKLLHSRPLEGTQDLEDFFVSLAPDGTAALVWSFQHPSQILVCDVPGGKKLGSVSLRRGHAYRAAVAPGGKAVAATIIGGIKHSLRVWDVAAGSERLLLEHEHALEEIAFSWDGKLTGATGADSTLRVWDVATGALLHKLPVHTRCFAFSPDGKCVAGECDDGKVRLWELATREQKAEFPSISARWLAFAPDGKVLVAGGQNGLVLWDVAHHKEVFRVPEVLARSVAFSPDGKTVAVSEGARIQLRDAVTGRPLLEQSGHGESVDAVAVSPDGKLLASVSIGRALCLWDAATGKLFHQLPGYKWASFGLGFSPDGKLLASGGDGVLHLWETATGKERRHFSIQEIDRGVCEPYLESLTLSSDGKRLAALSRSQYPNTEFRFQTNVWDAADGKLLHRRRLPDLEVSPRCLCFTPDVSGIAVPTPKGIAIQDTAAGKDVLEAPAAWSQPPGLLSLPVVFSRDGKLLAVRLARTDVPAGRGKRLTVTASNFGDILVADAATGQQVLRIDAVESNVLAFSSDGRMIATSDGDSISLRELATGKELFRRQQSGDLAGVQGAAPVRSLAFFPDGRRLATGLADGTVLVWDLTPGGEVVKAPSALWADLAGDDAARAYRAVCGLASATGVAFLRDHLRPVHAAKEGRVRQLLADLDASEFAVREKAANELTASGEQAEPALRQAVKESPSAEVRKRAEELLAAVRGAPSGETLQELRAIWALERAGTPEARRLLQTLAEGLPGARQTVQAKAALARQDK